MSTKKFERNMPLNTSSTVYKNVWTRVASLCHKVAASVTKYDKILLGNTLAAVQMLLPKRNGTKRKRENMIATAEPDFRTILESELRSSARKRPHVWQEAQDEYAELEQQFAAWLESLGHIESLFKQHVYENKDMSLVDLRQHRACLYCALWSGESIAVNLLYLKRPDKKTEIQQVVGMLDQKLDTLRETLHQWHSTPDSQADVPESLKQSFRELESGDLMPLDEALAD